MKIYLSGPITDYPQSKELFKGAEELFRMQGHEVLNPHEFEKPKGLTDDDSINWALWMAHDLKVIEKEKPDHLVMLPDWQGSKGAILEKWHADTLNIPCKEIKEFLR